MSRIERFLHVPEEVSNNVQVQAQYELVKHLSQYLSARVNETKNFIAQGQ